MCGAQKLPWEPQSWSSGKDLRRKASETKNMHSARDHPSPEQTCPAGDTLGFSNPASNLIYSPPPPTFPLSTSSKCPQGGKRKREDLVPSCPKPISYKSTLERKQRPLVFICESYGKSSPCRNPQPVKQPVTAPVCLPPPQHGATWPECQTL